MNSGLTKTVVAVVVALTGMSLGPQAASAAPPANDNFANAQVVGPALPVAVPASNVEATAEPGEPSISGNPAVSSVWFRWTAPAPGTVVVDLCKNGFTGSQTPFTAFAVRTGATLGTLALTTEMAGDCSRRFSAVAGVEYKIQVDYRFDQGNFTFRLRQLNPPSNDSFASAQVIGPALPINLNTTNVDSGWEAGEPPALGGSVQSRSVWYSWTAPDSGPVRMDVCDYEAVSGAGNRTVIAYTGATLGTLVAVTPGGGNCEANFTATSGVTYRIAFSGTVSGEGNFVLRLKSAPPPPNDDFANAIVVGPSLPAAAQANNEFATAQAGEPDHTGPGFPAARSVWYQWTPTRDIRVKIRACSRTFGARLGVYTGAAVNALTTEGELPPYAPHCSLLLNAVAGTNYWIAVAGGPQDGSYGLAKLDIHRLRVPANDNFTKATVLALKSSGSIRGTTVDATTEASEPSHVPGNDGPGQAGSVWYRWKATNRQPVILSACSKSERMRIAVYTGPVIDGLTQVTASETGCPAGSKGGRLALAPTPGVTYRILVATDLRDFDAAFTLSAQGPFLAPKSKFNLKGALRKCRKTGPKSKRNSCIRKARRQAATVKCLSILDSAKQAECVARARRR
jgi:hypothetical protein